MDLSILLKDYAKALDVAATLEKQYGSGMFWMGDKFTYKQVICSLLQGNIDGATEIIRNRSTTQKRFVLFYGREVTKLVKAIQTKNQKDFAEVIDFVCICVIYVF
jgi:hypothetical protein